MPCRAANAAYVRGRRMGVVYPDPCELVSAAYAAMHLSRLRAQGVGYRQAAKLAGVSEALVLAIRSQRFRFVHAAVVTRILTVEAKLAHGQMVTGWRTWRLIDSLSREGFTKTRIASMLGRQTPQLRLGHKHIRVKSALRVRAVWARVNNDALEHRDERRG